MKTNTATSLLALAALVPLTMTTGCRTSNDSQVARARISIELAFADGIDMAHAASILASRIRSTALGAKSPEIGLDIRVDGTKLMASGNLRVPAPCTADAYEGIVAAIKARIELPGSHFELREPSKLATREVADALRKRLFKVERPGVTISSVKSKNTIQVVGVGAAELAGHLEELRNETTHIFSEQAPDGATNLFICKDSGLDGRRLNSATVEDTSNVVLRFDDDGAAWLRRATGEADGSPLLVIIDGALFAAPRMMEFIRDGKVTLSLPPADAQRARQFATALAVAAFPEPPVTTTVTGTCAETPAAL